MSGFKYLLVAKMPYNQRQMYNIIADIEKYPQYIKWLNFIDILEDSEDRKVARLDVEFLNIKKSFVTEDFFTPHSQVIINHVDGPFNHLTGSWEITEIDSQSSRIDFYIEFDIKNKILSSVFGKVFQKSLSEIVRCFYERAIYLHGYGNFDMQIIKEQSQS